MLPGAYLLLFGASFTLEGDLGTARPFGIPWTLLSYWWKFEKQQLWRSSFQHNWNISGMYFSCYLHPFCNFAWTFYDFQINLGPHDVQCVVFIVWGQQWRSLKIRCLIVNIQPPATSLCLSNWLVMTAFVNMSEFRGFFNLSLTPKKDFFLRYWLYN